MDQESRKVERGREGKEVYGNERMKRSISWAGGTPRKIGWGCAARFSKPLPYLRSKPATLPTPFMT